jgi:hypothetical protein
LVVGELWVPAGQSFFNDDGRGMANNTELSAATKTRAGKSTFILQRTDEEDE